VWCRVQQDPDDVAVPVVDVVPVIVEDVPVMHGVVGAGEKVIVVVIGAGETVIVVVTGAAGLIVMGVGGGLSPPAPISVEPSGTPRRPMATEAIPVGDDTEAAGWASDALPATEQVPEPVPLRPPPSKVDGPALDIPDPVEVPDIALPMEVPVVELPMPVPIPALEVPSPKDACGIEPPMPEHALALPVVSAIGEAPTASGLVPGVAIAVAPRGIPVGATGEPGPMPSGEVMPTAGVGLPPICAKTGWLPTSVTTIATINGRFIITGFL
jgi:hypothetical protein